MADKQKLKELDELVKNTSKTAEERLAASEELRRYQSESLSKFESDRVDLVEGLKVVWDKYIKFIIVGVCVLLVIHYLLLPKISEKFSAETVWSIEVGLIVLILAACVHIIIGMQTEEGKDVVRDNAESWMTKIMPLFGAVGLTIVFAAFSVFLFIIGKPYMSSP